MRRSRTHSHRPHDGIHDSATRVPGRRATPSPTVSITPAPVTRTAGQGLRRAVGGVQTGMTHAARLQSDERLARMWRRARRRTPPAPLRSEAGPPIVLMGRRSQQGPRAASFAARRSGYDSASGGRARLRRAAAPLLADVADLPGASRVEEAARRRRYRARDLALRWIRVRRPHRTSAPRTAATPCRDGAGPRTRDASPTSISRPRYSTAIRSARYRTTPRSCEMNTYVTPSTACMSASRFRIAACTETSRADVGSSQTTRRGSPANARAMATRCFNPPDS
jgi:hypothetical protein